MKEIKEKLEKLDDKLDAIDKTLVKQEGNLQHHMYRTEIAEKRLAHIETTLEPIKSHVNKMSGALKLLGIVALVLSIIGGILKLFGVV